MLMESTPCPFLDKQAQALLDEARQAFKALDLETRSIISSFKTNVLLSWQGDCTNDALALMLNYVGIPCESDGLVLTVDGSEGDTLKALSMVAQLDASDIQPLLENVENMVREKWDWVLPSSLLMKSYASSQLNIEEAIAFAKKSN